MFHLTWLGQGGYALQLNGKTVYVDPYCSNTVMQGHEGFQRLVPPPLTPRAARPDYYLSTHDHMDHLDLDFIREMDWVGVTFFCPPSCKAALEQLGVPAAQVTAVQRGDFYDLSEFTLRAVYADHTHDSVGFVIGAAGVNLYITGDTLYGEGVGAGTAADVICCCINGKLGNMDAAQAVQVALRSGAALAIPNHYGMFAENTCDPLDFTRPAQASGLRTCTMQHNETVDLLELLKQS